MKRFEWIDHPSDVGFRAYGRDMSEAFANAARALFEVMVDTTTVKPACVVKVRISAEDLGALLYEWLDRLIGIHDSEGLVFSDFDVRIVKRNGGFELIGEARGEPFQPEKHQERTAVKAMTYHMMEIHDEPGRCWVQAVVDI